MNGEARHRLVGSSLPPSALSRWRYGSCVMRLLYLGTSGYRPLTTHIERLTRKGSRMPASLDRRNGRWLWSVSDRDTRTRVNPFTPEQSL